MSKRLFDDQVAWITGAGSGIGRALALELARQGAVTVVSGRRADRLDEVVAAISSQGGRALSLACDVTDDDAVARTVATIAAELGGLDLAIANAGMAVRGRFEAMRIEQWRRQFDINVLGLVSTARHALPELRKRRGRLALMGSVAGYICHSGSSAYCASKFAVRAIGETLSQELHGSGVSCTSIHPGYVESEIAKVDDHGVFDPTREDRRPRQLMWPADRAARVMVRAIYKRKRECVVTGHGKLGAWMGRHAPGLVHLAVTRRRG